MSNKCIDELELAFNLTGSYVSIVIDDPITYVVLSLFGFTGVGYLLCGDSDTYDMQFGVAGATRKALKHIAEQQEKLRISSMTTSKLKNVTMGHNSMSAL